MKRIFQSLILSLFFCNGAIGQTGEKNESQRLTSLFLKLEGTFQVQVINSRNKTEIPLRLMDSIQAKRHQTEVVYFPYKPNVRVMVLPFSVISQPGFKPISKMANIFEN